MLERDVEKHTKRHAESKGWITRKWTSPGHSFVPDQIFLNYVPFEHRELIAKYIRFVEMKRPGGKCTPGQLREHARLRGQGFAVDVIDNVEAGKRVIDDHSN